MPLYDGRFSRRGTPVPSSYQGDFLGIDTGLVHLAVDSDGVTYPLAETNRTEWAAIVAMAYDGPLLPTDQKRRLEDLCSRTAQQIARKALERRVPVAMEKLLRPGLSDILRLTYDRLSGALCTETRKREVGIKFVGWVNTSRTCPQCDHCEAANRANRGLFICAHCGFTGQADHVGAINIARRAKTRVVG